MNDSFFAFGNLYIQAALMSQLSSNLIKFYV